MLDNFAGMAEERKKIVKSENCNEKKWKGNIKEEKRKRGTDMWKKIRKSKCMCVYVEVGIWKY